MDAKSDVLAQGPNSSFGRKLDDEGGRRRTLD
jgi:hypothetical protein